MPEVPDTKTSFLFNGNRIDFHRKMGCILLVHYAHVSDLNHKNASWKASQKGQTFPLHVVMTYYRHWNNENRSHLKLICVPVSLQKKDHIVGSIYRAFCWWNFLGNLSTKMSWRIWGYKQYWIRTFFWNLKNLNYCRKVLDPPMDDICTNKNSSLIGHLYSSEIAAIWDYLT